MNKDFESEVFGYIATLKTLNQQLLTSLKQSVMLLNHLKHSVSEPEALQELLDRFQEVIRLAEAEIEGFKIQ